jgi:UPF0755 protein
MRILKYFFVLIIVLGVASLSYFGYLTFFQIPADSPSGKYTLNIQTGDNLSVVADYLKEDEVISSKGAFMFRGKYLNSLGSLQIGEYSIEVPASQQNLLEQIKSQSQQKTKKNQELANREAKKITVKEGENLDSIVGKLDKAGVVKASKMKNFLQNPKSFDTEQYEFLPEALDCDYGNIKECAKYYPEGYFYPDTYSFFVDSTPKEVTAKFLDNFKNKVWSKLSKEVGSQDFQKIVIMASVIEKETGRPGGVTSKNKNTLAEERKVMAGVFFNRLDEKMKWQSDPTIEYGTDARICQKTLEIDNCFYLNDDKAKHLYNTYIMNGYPVGPISNPQFDNIQAVLQPVENNYLFFLSDKSGKKYFSQTNSEHSQKILEIKKMNQDS